MKYLFLTLLFFSCSRKYGQDYIYTYTSEVTYTDGSLDTIKASYTSFKGNPVNLYLSSSSGDAFHSGTNSPCLQLYCSYYDTTLVCGVRKYKVLLLTKIKK